MISGPMKTIASDVASCRCAAWPETSLGSLKVTCLYLFKTLQLNSVLRLESILNFRVMEVCDTRVEKCILISRF